MIDETQLFADDLATAQLVRDAAGNTSHTGAVGSLNLACLVLVESAEDPKLGYFPRSREHHVEYDDGDPPNIVREWWVEVARSRTIVTQGRVWCEGESGSLILIDVSSRGAYQVGPLGPHEPRLSFDERGRARGC